MSMDINNELPAPDALLQPQQLWTRAEVLTRPCPIPRQAGVYGWYFDVLPGAVVADGAHHLGNWTLLYVGISPGKPPQNGRPPSRHTLRDRIRNHHYRGNAEGSTLRLTLGCLLQEELGLELRRVGSGRRMTFHDGEKTLSAWMEHHARVAWIEHPEPWELEHQLIQTLALPLNLAQNHSHPFHPTLSSIRRAAKIRARELAVL